MLKMRKLILRLSFKNKHIFYHFIKIRLRWLKNIYVWVSVGGGADGGVWFGRKLLFRKSDDVGKLRMDLVSVEMTTHFRVCCQVRDNTCFVCFLTSGIIILNYRNGEQNINNLFLMYHTLPPTPPTTWFVPIYGKHQEWSRTH